MELDEIPEQDLLNLSTSFAREIKKIDLVTAKVQKLSKSGTFVALIKGYTALASLLMPYSFLTGGWLISAGMLICSSIITTICACMLVDAGTKLKIYNYPLVVEKTLGKPAKIGLDVMVALTQWSFVVSHITYLYTTYKQTVDQIAGGNSQPIFYIIGLLMIYTPISWARNIAKFAVTYTIGNLLILLTLIVISVYSIDLMVD
jgi:amino acid permease